MGARIGPMWNKNDTSQDQLARLAAAARRAGGGGKEPAPTTPAPDTDIAAAMAAAPGEDDYVGTVSKLAETLGGPSLDQLRTVVDPGERVDYGAMSYDEIAKAAGDEYGRRVDGMLIQDDFSIKGQKGAFDTKYKQAVMNRGGAYADAVSAYDKRYRDLQRYYVQTGKWGARAQEKTERLAKDAYASALQQTGEQNLSPEELFKQNIGKERLQQYWTESLIGAQDDKFRKYEEDLSYNEALKTKLQQRQELENEMMKSSPEYQQMQEAMAIQRESVAQQKAQMDMIQGQYEQLQQDYAERESELTQYLEGMGDTERKALEKKRQQMKAAQKEDLMKRGLTSTTALNAALRGVDRQADESLGAMEERLRTQKLQYKAQFSGETLAAKEKASQIATQFMDVNFAAQQTVPNTMMELAAMLSEQRMAKQQTRSGAFSAALSAEASRYGARQSAAASRFASLLGYKSDMAATAQRESASKRDTATKKFEIGQDTALGYMNLANQQALANIQGENQVRANRALPGKTLADMLSKTRPKVGSFGW